MKRYTLTAPVNVLGIIHNQVGLSPITIDPELLTATVTCSLFTTVDEVTPSFTRTIVITGSQYTALGFNLNTLLSQLKVLLNVT